MNTLTELKSFCKLLAKESSKVIMQYYRSDFNIEIKPDQSPVTIADKKSEELMRTLIMQNYPDHGILGEEFGEHNSEAEYKWILDPIDGTKSFISGVPLFGTLIALLKNNEPLLGVINHPVLNELLIGDNSVAELNDVKVTMRKCEDISAATLLTSDHLMFGKYRNKISFDKLTEHVKLYRTWGDCYGYLMVATGRAELMVDPVMNLWDAAALQPILEEAGGAFTDWRGTPTIHGREAIATNGLLHQAVLDLVRA